MKKAKLTLSSDLTQKIHTTGKDITRRVSGFCIPSELESGFRICEALSDDEHWAVYIALMKHGELTLDRLATLFGGTYHELVMITDDLVKGGLVEEFTIWEFDEGNYERTYYRVTTGGLRFYVRMCESLLPSRDSALYKHILKRQEKLGVPFNAVSQSWG